MYLKTTMECMNLKYYLLLFDASRYFVTNNTLGETCPFLDWTGAKIYIGK